MVQKKMKVLLVLVLFAALFSIRLIHLAADPPYDLSTSGGPYGDPGGYSFNARNKILFGTWEVDNYNPMYVSILPHYVTYFSFKLLGIGFAQQNLVPVMFSFLSLIFFYVLLKRRFSFFSAFLGTILLGLNYLFLMYSRIADRVMPPLLFLLMGIYFLEKGKQKSGWLLGAGGSFLLAMISKSVVFYVLGCVGLGYLVFILIHSSLRDVLKRIGFLSGGFFILFLPWFLFIYLPHTASTGTFFQLNRQFLLPPANLSLIWKNFWYRPHILLNHMPVVTAVGAFSFLVILFKIIHFPKKSSLMDWLFLFWFGGGTFYFSVIYQRVTRHFIPHTVPSTFLALFFLSLLFRSSPFPKPKKLKGSFFFFVFLWMLFPASLILKYAYPRAPLNFDSFLLNSALLTLSVLSTFLVYLLMKSWKKGSFPVNFKKAVGYSLVLGIMVLQIPQYLDWALSPHYQFRNISRDLGKILDNAALGGLWAPIICLENKHKSHEYYPGVINDKDHFIQKYGITHIFTTTAFGENKNFERNFPVIMKKAQLMARYHIWKVQALLYRVHPKPKKRDTFEAELFTQKGSTPRYDPEASQKLAVFSSSGPPRFVSIVSPERQLPKGKYEVVFRIKKNEEKNRDQRLARLDVVSSESRKLFVFQDILPQNLNHHRYQEISLSLNLPWAQRLKFRVYSQGTGSFWVDQIQTIPHGDRTSRDE